ncbi:hypothetical protein [Paracoccus sp. NSM]|uniref:hypothetical protein n=1 Tax=Paracoccus sp. NSM TaxID=3457784 RepID=UPI004036D821
MFMTTTLAHYQFPLFGAASSALQTEIGADQRSLFLRPITSVGSMTELAGAEVVPGVEKTTPPMEFRKWMESLQRYEDGARKPADWHQPADAATAATPADGQADAQDDGADLAMTGDPEPAAPQSAPDDAAPGPGGTQSAGTGGSTQGQGGLLGGIIRF